MPVDDPSDVFAEQGKLKKRVERLEVAAGSGGDSDHAGTGFNSVALGPGAVASNSDDVALGDGSEASGGFGASALGANTVASGSSATAVGSGATASGTGSVAVGVGAFASAQYAIAIGRQSDAQFANSIAFGRQVTTDATFQIRVGTSSHEVIVDGDLTVAGTFSNPSARHLKRDIIPAPDMPGIFPDLVEYEYIAGDGSRRLGYIADELVGTDAERFVKFDDEGSPKAIDYLGLVVAQNAVLNARIAVLEQELRG